MRSLYYDLISDLAIQVFCNHFSFFLLCDQVDLEKVDSEDGSREALNLSNKTRDQKKFSLTEDSRIIDNSKASNSGTITHNNQLSLR